MLRRVLVESIRRNAWKKEGVLRSCSIVSSRAQKSQQMLFSSSINGMNSPEYIVDGPSFDSRRLVPVHDNDGSVLGAKETREEAVAALEVGEWYEARVTKIIEHGAIVRLTGCGTTGLIHLSELDTAFIKDASTVVSLDEVLPVRLLSKDGIDRIAFSAREAGLIKIPDNAKAVAVFRLPYIWTTRKIAKIFSEEFGKVIHVDLPTKRKDSERVVAFVIFEDEASALNCIERLPGNRLRLDSQDMAKMAARSFSRSDFNEDQHHDDLYSSDDHHTKQHRLPQQTFDKTARIGVKLADDYLEEFITKTRTRAAQLEQK